MFTLSTLLLLFWVLSTVIYYAWLYFFKPNTQRLPPGPSGLPFLGNLLSLDPDLHTYFAALAKIHGPIYKLRLGSKLAIVIASPAVAHEILKDHDTVFANRDVPVAGRVATYGGFDIAWSPYGAEWRMLRKVCTVKMLSNTTLDSVYDLRRNEVRKTVSYLYGRAGSAVNVGEQVFLTVMNVITSMMWGGAVEEAERETLGAEFRELVAETTRLLGKPNVSDFFPMLARFDLQGVEKEMHVLVSRFDGIFEKMIGERVKVGEEKDGNKKERKDFLQFLLDLKDSQDFDSKTPFTITHLKALLMDMVTGATDTSSNTIEFAMAEIIQKAEVMKRVEEELEDVVGKDKMVEETHIRKLPYLQAVMKETLRLHPALPLLIPHCPSQTTNVGGYTIPKGSRVFINVWAIHRDPSIWERPLEFDPSRFLDANWDFSGNDFSYFPFGSGRRICAGIAMAERTFLYFLATLLHLFDWRIPEGENLDLSEKFGIVLKKKTPLVAIPTPRFSNPHLYN
ncbi:geraniol 8-hydroxylase-like [Vigna unguiculata]|uniref:Flavonoid 3'-monooxygenase n=1 Tax=Vigna unguiculata TaxID=3917 RepID=A0A4D6KX43_VIGUN|nr:geraniol 8-hydroxylase-like [Vigna unguiculata]QCD81213.1 flavonoid 3'-monooxygenase [Vigna unguiculata]